MDIGISEAARKKVADDLQDFLASTYALYLKTQNFHWNIVGPEFFSLHVLFEKHYEDMAEAVDEIAERIRALGFFVEASFSSFKKRSSVSEPHGKVSFQKMIMDLVKGHEIISRMGRPLITKSQALHEDITADMVIKRLAFHEKAAWMLRSHLGK